MAPFESVRFAKDGRELAVSVAVSPVHDPNGRLVGASAIFRDISALKRARQALEEETRRKDEFLARCAMPSTSWARQGRARPGPARPWASRRGSSRT